MYLHCVSKHAAFAERDVCPLSPIKHPPALRAGLVKSVQFENAYLGQSVLTRWGMVMVMVMVITHGQVYDNEHDHGPSQYPCTSNWSGVHSHCRRRDLAPKDPRFDTEAGN
jgi:hypothetical protein